ncbi:MAG: tRNA (N(6)-L-threonylcarbamoyladenosine(37)-C(2))-methylthiotransferase MtaB [Simkaniaceae bacterium]|nr:tRNA (N(6)-L-threonylcarbamoyladenosine(37)-C(2))-methylthiotransferase MtaB [Simkaniaceae bacterium]MCF7852698.1 tRNA (N(6)-L-threonylcarbamoyladenosine(37)-C(2))-methylthiotransferase MtaB [Simkaniaceae bacterium]
MRNQSFKVVTLGCRTNQYESQAYRDQLIKMGFSEVIGEEAADICIVNTCTVTESADQRSRYQINQFAKKNPTSRIVVTGCLAERAKEDLQNMPGVSAVISNLEKEELIAQMFPGEDVPEFSIEHFHAHTRAFVKIQDGCNSFCSYCIIPYVRGRSRSKKTKDILREIEGLVANGFKEVVLTGVNIGDFDGGVARKEPKDRLSDLVRLVDEIDGLERIRISSIDPDEVDDDLLRAVIEGKKTCHSMHVVLQAGSNVTLKKMNRKYTREEYYDAVYRLKSACPDFTFTTDIIVGFPGETERDFQETLSVMRDIKFAKVHMFPYSSRPGTRASRFINHLPKEVIEERRQLVLREAEKIAFELREPFVGRTMKILLENVDATDPDWISGHTDNFLHVKIPKMGYRPNEIIEVVLEENTPEGFIGQVVFPVQAYVHN